MRHHSRFLRPHCIQLLWHLTLAQCVLIGSSACRGIQGDTLKIQTGRSHSVSWGHPSSLGGGGPLFDVVDAAQFAVHTIARWWQEQGRARYPDARDLYIVADGGGSHGYPVRLGKVELQRFATAPGVRVHVSHFPPGTRQWNYI